jgi:hypothetical protein
MSVKEINKRAQQVETKEEVKHVASEQTTHAHSHHHVSFHDKMLFFSGAESALLPVSWLQRVRELQTSNDELQRQVASLRHECSLSADPLKIMNDIQYATSTIAKNTGEILNLFRQNEKRLAHIAEIERQNLNLQQEITDTMSSFGSNNQQDKQTEFAAGYFNAKSSYENNAFTLQQLKSVA